MVLTLKEISCLKDAEIIQQKFDEILSFLNQKCDLVEVGPYSSKPLCYDRDKNTLTVDLSLTIPTKI